MRNQRLIKEDFPKDKTMGGDIGGSVTSYQDSNF